MGFYLRKSISVGPFRFNLSKSGVGVSAGVKGLRFGAGPHGNYVHMGRGGLYYRATLPPTSSTPSKSFHQSLQSSYPQIPPGTHAPLEEIESADVGQIVDSSSRLLLDELNHKQKSIRLCPIVTTASVAVIIIGFYSGWQNWILGLVVLAAAAAIYVSYSRDVLAKTAVVFYDLDSEMENLYGQFHSCAEKLASCAAAWHIEAEGKVYDRKYHAGASHLLRRKSTVVRKSDPPYVKTNIETVAIGVGRQTLHFFPERVLIYDNDGVGAVGYQELNINVKTTNFVESDSVPSDAKIVGKTWKYVNKSGGPDRRFKDNRALPICLYEEISFSSQTGLREVLQVSQSGFGESFAEAIALMGKKIPKEKDSMI